MVTIAIHETQQLFYLLSAVFQQLAGCHGHSTSPPKIDRNSWMDPKNIPLQNPRQFFGRKNLGQLWCAKSERWFSMDFAHPSSHPVDPGPRCELCQRSVQVGCWDPRKDSGLPRFRVKNLEGLEGLSQNSNAEFWMYFQVMNNFFCFPLLPHSGLAIEIHSVNPIWSPNVRSKVGSLYFHIGAGVLNRAIGVKNYPS